MSEIPFGVWAIAGVVTLLVGVWLKRRLSIVFAEAKAQLFTAPSLVATVVHDLVIGALVAVAISVRMVYLGLV